MSAQEFNFIDIHYHSNPDLYDRRHRVLEIGRLYKELNGAVVLKSHLGSTAVQATISQQEGLPVFPSIVLNKISGGLSCKSVIRALAEYQPIIPSKLIVHLPTITGRNHTSKLTRKVRYPDLANTLFEPETIFNSSNQLKHEVVDLLKLSRDYPVVISTGHTSKEETYALINACEQLNVPALLLNQPANPMTGLNATELLEITNRPFVWAEQTALTYLLGYQNQEDFKSVLNEVPRVIYSSDLGQTSQMDIEEWLSTSNNWFTDFNISTSRKEDICKNNPAQLILI